MSSGKTEALGLNQWVLSDAFRMEEFNEDNRKVDAAVARKAELVKLKEITTTTGGVTQIDVDVSGINFTQYQYVLLDCYVTQHCNIRANGSNFNCAYSSMGGTPMSGQFGFVYGNQWCRVAFLTHGRNNTIHSLIDANSFFAYGYQTQIYVADLKTLNFVTLDTPYKFTEGNTFRFWGVRA